jgi:hypothetical protein
MKWLNVVTLATGLIGMVANILGILTYLETHLWPARKPEPGSILVVSVLLMAYSLAVWSAFCWRWVTRQPGRFRNGRSIRVLLHALAAFPPLTLWSYLLLSLIGTPGATATEQWLLALALAWIETPFVAISMTALGDTLGPLLSRED